MLTSTEARKGEKVTTINRLGGTGIAFLVEGEVYCPSGSYLAVTAKSRGMVSYSRDGGEGYNQKVRQMFGGN